MPKKFTQQNIIQRIHQIHADSQQYDFSLVMYKQYDSTVNVTCKFHGKFCITPRLLLRGSGCKKCANEKTRLKCSHTKEQFKKKATNIHSKKYNYDNVIYKNNCTPVQILCYNHGLFSQTPADHIDKGAGCPTCGIESRIIKNTYSTDEFVIVAKNIHGDQYEYCDVQYQGCFIKVNIICKKHGTFKQRPNDHLQGQGCPLCNISRGEWKIVQLLNKLNILYIRQYAFDDCTNMLSGNKLKTLKFDFFIPNINLLIEYDGIQHFFPTRFNGISLERAIKIHNKTKKHDKIKNRYVQEHNIPLIRIPYTQIDNIESLINFDTFKKYSIACAP